jgi:hypothetical protein
MLDSVDKTALLDDCASHINQLIERLARDGQERLDHYNQIGVQLLRAKEIDPKNFVPWTKKTFGHEREWRSTLMRLARRWNELPQARTWAEGEGSKLATLYSVDGALELLDAWDVATGHESPKPKRSSPKKAKTNVEGDLCLKQTPEQAEIAVLRQQLQEESDEAAHFRLQLPLNIRSEARALAVRVCAHEAEAERQLRAIAREHRWLFRSLCEDLGGDISGEPDRVAQHSSSETPTADEESAASATGETFADAPKSEESPSDEAGAKREEVDFKGASIAPAAAPDTLGASPRLEDESPQNGEGVQETKLEKADTSRAAARRTRTVIVETRKSRRKNLTPVDAWWERNPDRPPPLACDVGEIPR